MRFLSGAIGTTRTVSVAEVVQPSTPPQAVVAGYSEVPPRFRRPMLIYRTPRRALSAAVLLSCMSATSLLAQAPKVKVKDSAKVAKDSIKMAKAAKDSGS